MANVFVVGGAGGLGSAVVAKLLARGDRVEISVLNDKEEEAARTATPGVAAVHRLDLGDAVAVKSGLASAIGGSQLDAVIVCAAIGPLGPVETTPIEVVRRTMEINCVSDIAVFQAAMPALRKSRGRLIFVSSMAGVASIPFVGVYSGSKFALEGVADAMRREAAPQGVNVVLVEPGGIRTPMVTNQLEEVAQRIQSLGDEERELYGYLYRGFQTAARESYERGGSTPEQIADVIMTALDAPQPAARYIAGPDAEELIAVARRGDAELDAVFEQANAEPAAA